MKLVTAAQMRQIDQLTIDAGIPGDQLMENAGEAIASAILTRHLNAEITHHVVIGCGRGKNGGDGFVVARHLFERGIPVTVFFLGPVSELSEETRKNYERAITLGLNAVEVKTEQDVYQVAGASLVVDAVLGTGGRNAPQGLTAVLVESLNHYFCEVVAIDVPSGVDADDGSVPGCAVEADYTYTLGLPKMGLYVSPGREFAGKVAVVDIGLNEGAVDSVGQHIHLIQEDQVAELLPYREPDAHKGDFGKLLVVAGSITMSGAAELVANAAYRTGCGLVTVCAPASTQTILAMKMTESITHRLPEVRNKGVLALRGLGELRKLTHECDAVVIGPGLGQHHETAELVRRVIASCTKPMLIDADAINALAGLPEFLPADGNQRILSPHPGEFRRLTGEAVPESLDEKIELVRHWAKKLSAVLVLKGSPTLVATIEGSTWLNPTGNSGMATGGSGDVLSGIIGSLLAQSHDAVSAALCGTYVHGLAGDFARDTFTNRSMIATDIIECLPEAFGELE